MSVKYDKIGLAVKQLDSKISCRVRTGLMCLRCGHKEESRGKGSPNENNNRIQDAHIFSRVYLLVRWDIDNHISLCWKCERWWHDNYKEALEWVKPVIGEQKYKMLEYKVSLSEMMGLIYRKGEHRELRSSE